MLTQRLQQHGVITDLTEVGPSDVAQMANRAEQAKQQAQYATVYSRAAKSVFKSLVKVKAAQAKLYQSAHESLKEADRHTLSALKADLNHGVHAVKMQAKADGERQVAEAKKVSVQEIEQARAYGRLIQLGAQHRQALKAAQPKRRKLFGLL
ncbi:MAG: hypothetical protein ACFB2W_00740 [Leptolyngbyaceae cyanobacterium]